MQQTCSRVHAESYHSNATSVTECDRETVCAVWSCSSSHHHFLQQRQSALVSWTLLYLLGPTTTSQPATAARLGYRAATDRPSRRRSPRSPCLPGPSSINHGCLNCVDPTGRDGGRWAPWPRPTASHAPDRAASARRGAASCYWLSTRRPRGRRRRGAWFVFCRSPQASAAAAAAAANRD